MNKQIKTAIRAIQPKILYFGTPVVLLSTLNEDGTTNLTPMSSAWALGNRIVLGLGEGGKGAANLLRCGECVVNLPDASHWEHVEKLAKLTGANPVPDYKQELYRFEHDKFSAGSFTPLASDVVRPQRVEECPLQIEAKVVNLYDTDGFTIIEVEAQKVHAHEAIMLNEQHINPTAWNPLIYNFRHYFGLDQELGKTFKSET
ncbi:flavin reductase family protein [Paenibacillus sp. OAS669]|uniref:flavin reductase family protein n=1 Tax=Paenibacillus sp. OAS669 TaxID=2663821 RepID=UPI00178A2F3B|nr:flavin reductase family protein [Paenibacillus sp. OAS669]MBE1445852.1 flavin reductase (DIM6/NTAB) family NADH-FMN oxidoreductase RutF [Paenibacillus sp. OAS669]